MFFLKKVRILIFLKAALASLTVGSFLLRPQVLWGCEIYKDKTGIFHLREKDEKQVMACIGYVHGSTRFWQMDFFRKIAQGRRSEILGKKWIALDFFMRLLGLNEKAKSIFENLSEKEKSFLNAYAVGVQKGMKEAFNSPDQEGVYEFSQLDYQAESWNPEDTISLILLQSFDQTRRSFEKQLLDKKYLDKKGEISLSDFSYFEDKDLPWTTSILKPGEYDQGSLKEKAPLKEDAFLKAERFFSFFQDKNPLGEFDIQADEKKSREGIGSNNWVVSIKKSKTGNAWLANDPHLALSYPPFWQWIHVETHAPLLIDAIGASFPGIPFILSGTNRKVSWGVTNAFLPVSRLSEVPESELKNTITKRPVIWFKWWRFRFPFFFKTYRRTLSGHRILPRSSVFPTGSKEALILRWTGFDIEAKDFSALFDFWKAGSVREIDHFFSKIGVPSLNFVFADTQGQIGYRAVGRTPRYFSKIPSGILKKSLESFENDSAFSHPLAPEEMPHIIEPTRGYVVSANNIQWPSDSHWKIGNAFYPSLRAYRIEELLKQKEKHDFKSLQMIQCDLQAVDARFLLPLMLRGLSQEKKEIFGDAVKILSEWNFETDKKCLACGVYRQWVGLLMEDQHLTEEALYWRLKEKGNGFQEILENTLTQALKDLGYQNGKSLMAWGSFHQVSFSHLSDDLFEQVKLMGTPGDNHSINVGKSYWNGRFFYQTLGASQRLIVEMSDPPTVYSVLAGSNTDTKVRDIENNKSEWQNWVNCRLHKREFPLDWEKVRGAYQKEVYEELK